VDVSVLFGRELAARGHEVDWLLQSEDQHSRDTEETWNSWRVFVGATDTGTSLWRRLRKHLLGLSNDFRVFRLARENDYDFIQVKDKFLSAVLALIAAWKNDCGFVYWLSYPYPEASIYESRVGTARYRFLYLVRGVCFRFLLYRIILPRADHVFVQSEQMKLDVAKEGIDINKIDAVPMGYSPEDVAEATDPGIGDDTAAIVYIGTLLKTRRFDFLVRVLALVLDKVPDAVLYMIGPEELPGDAAVLIEEAERLGIRDKLILTGRVPRVEALGYVGSARVCVSPFYPTPILNSTSPTKLIEYMAVGRPVVANDHPEQKRVIAESGGGLCVPYSEPDFADAIVELLNDRTTAEHMGELGASFVARERTYTAIANRVDGQYRQLLDKLRRSAEKEHPA
jgi:glycosyltransferase involved in cell wall biosynthesis